jgi:hypothetical protein
LEFSYALFAAIAIWILTGVLKKISWHQEMKSDQRD